MPLHLFSSTVRRWAKFRPAQPSEPPRLTVVPRPTDLAPPRPVLGYVALAEGEVLDTAVRHIGEWCEARGWRLERVIHDAPASTFGRPGLAHVFDEIAAGRAAGLVVTRLRDLTDSVAELGPLLEWFVDADAMLIALDYHLDTSSPQGALAARALVVVSEWETDRIERRTRAGLDASRHGATSGPAVRDDPKLSALIATMRADGMSLQAIADALNEAGVPTLRGGSRWRPSSVQTATGYKRPPAKARGFDLPRFRRLRETIRQAP